MTDQSPLTFIHTADWHIGNTFGRFDREMRKKLNRAIFLTIEMIFMYAEKKKIPLILCAGDVVDNGQMCSKDDLFKLFAIVKKYPGIQFIVIAGNHDPLVPRNIYRRVDKGVYPANFRLVEADEILEYPEMNLRIWASSLREKNGNYNPLGWVKDKQMDSSQINVGLCHGSIKNDVFSNNNFPIEPDTAGQLRLDYLALGDWHSYTQVNKRTYYPGTPEALKMDDTGFPLEVVIDAPGAVPRVEPIKNLSQYKWMQVEELLNKDTFRDFKTRLESVGEKEIRQLTVSGFLPLETYKTYKELIAMNRSRYLEIIDKVAVQQGEGLPVETPGGFLGEITQRLMALKETAEPLPDGIPRVYANAQQGEVFKLADSISNQEIVDNALLMMLEYVKELR